MIRQRMMLVGLTAMLVGGCAIEGRRDWSAAQLRGWNLAEPLPKVGFTLESMTGGPFEFHTETEGFVTLLFFGYTYCPDVCPLHMANISAVLKKLPPEVANRIKVVFVTTDPERDTPERLREWLGAFDRKFIGLLGTVGHIGRGERRAGVDRASRRTTRGASLWRLRNRTLRAGAGLHDGQQSPQVGRCNGDHHQPHARIRLPGPVPRHAAGRAPPGQRIVPEDLVLVLALGRASLNPVGHIRIGEDRY